MKQEPKYEFINGAIWNRATGEPIPEDEPVFVLRGRDVHAVATLIKYSEMVETQEHAKAVWLRIEQFKKFRQDHPDRMKEPDTQVDGNWR